MNECEWCGTSEAHGASCPAEPYDLKLTREVMQKLNSSMPPHWRDMLERGAARLEIESDRKGSVSGTVLVFKMRLRPPSAPFAEE